MKKRPIGITILSILHFTGGVGTIIFYFFFNNLLNQVSDELGFSSIVMIASIVFLGLLSIITAIGMWLGKRWGWWLAAFYYIYAMIRYGNHIITVLTAPDWMLVNVKVSYLVTKDIIRIIIHGLIFIYFFKNNVKDFFRLTNLSKKKVILILVGITVGIFLITFLANNKLLSNKSQENNPENEIRYSEENVVIDDTTIDQGDIYQIMEPLLYNVTENNYDQELKNYSVEQKYVHAILNYKQEVDIGGHELFYLDYLGMVWEDAMESFQKIGMTEYYDLIKESANKLGGSPSKDKEERRTQMEELYPKFDDLDDRFFKLEENKPIEEALLKYIKDNREKFYYNGTVRKPVSS